MPKKIIIVSALFSPEITPRAFRATELAKEFKRQGHLVTVLIPFKGYNYDSFSNDYVIEFKDLGKLHLNEIKLQNNTFGNFFKRVLRKILLMLFEYPHIELTYRIYKALQKESNYDLIISNAWPYPVHWGVALARNKRNRIAKTWVADCGDPYYKDKNSGYYRLFYFKYIEKWFSRKADYITIPKIDMISNYFKEFHYKIREIPQGFDLKNIRLHEGPLNNKIPTFAFAGIFIPKVRDPKTILEFLIELNCNFKFVIYTDDDALIKPYYSKLNSKIVINKFIPREELIFELSKMDFLVNISYDPVNQSPSKLIDYSLTKRPILNISDGLDKHLFYEFLNGNYTNQFCIKDISKHDIQNVAKQFLSIV